MSYQSFTLVGNLGKDPEMRYMPSGKSVTSFSVAQSSQYVNGNGETIKTTLWFRVSAFGKMGEVCNQYLKKGSKVLIVGQLKGDPTTGGPKIWTRQDGTPGASFEIAAQTVRFLSPKSEDGHADEGPIPSDTGMEMTELPPEDDIPF